MQFRTIAISLFAALVAADHISDLASQVPSCAQSCLASAAQKAGCDATDYKCQCGKAGDITGNSALCLTTSCSSDDAAGRVLSFLLLPPRYFPQTPAHT